MASAELVTGIAIVGPTGPSGSTGPTGVTSFPNLLLDNDASFETSIGGWTQNNGSTISRSTSTALVGSSSLQVTCTGPNQGAILKTSNAVSVTPFQTYTGVVSVNPSATGTFQVGISYLDSTRTQISFDQDFAPATVCQAGVWTQVSVSTLGSYNEGNEAFAVLAVNQTGTSASTFNIDCVGVAPGLGTVWSPGKMSMTGSGVPVANAPAGTYYYRTDTSSTANQRIYVNTSAGSGTTWTGIV